ncbi:PorV/PorQ family protein [bacterium]|nr:PorV/PorQ family protein [bacterium]
MVRKIVILLVVLTALFSSASADLRQSAVLFLMIHPGARPTGMGESFVALSDDPTATYYNPAGLGRYPLSSSWYEFEFDHPEEQIIALALIKSGRVEIDYRKYDMWVATENSLYKHTSKGWNKELIYVTGEDEHLTEILKRLFPSLSEEQIKSSIFSRIVNHNKLSGITLENDIMPVDFELKIPYSIMITEKITCLYGDKSKNLWIGTENGLYRYSKSGMVKIREKSSPKDVRVNMISEDDAGGIWVATDNGVYRKRGAKWRQFSPMDGLPSKKVTGVFPISSSEVWCSTENGVAVYRGMNWSREYTFRLEGKRLTWGKLIDLVFDKPLGNRRDMTLLELTVTNNIQDASETDTISLESVKIPYSAVFEGEIYSVARDRSRNLWFGTRYGIKKMSSEHTWKFFGYQFAKVTEATTISDFVEARWPSLDENTRMRLRDDILKFNRSNRMELSPGDIVAIPSSPTSGKAYSVVATGSKLYFGTEYGVLVYSKGKFRYYSHSGLDRDPTVAMTERGGEIWFATQNKVVVYSKGKSGITAMHVQWLPELASDIYYEFLAGTHYLEGWGTVGGSITFLSMGKNVHTNPQGDSLGVFSSYDMAIALSYGLPITHGLSAGVTLKYIYSHLADVGAGSEQGKGIAHDAAVDLGILYKTPIRGLNLGLTIQNLGPDIAYIDAAQADPLPRNAKFGIAYNILNSSYNKLTVLADLNKDLIDIGYEPQCTTSTGKKDYSCIFKEELKEVIENVGVEYSYGNFVSLRGGYVWDTEGCLKYATFGAGLHYRNFSFDFGYIPKQKDVVLSGIKRISMTLQF